MLTNLVSGLKRLLDGPAQTKRGSGFGFAVGPDHKRFFEENGYLILPGLLSTGQVEALRCRLDTLWDRRHEQKDVAIDIYFEMPDEARIYFSKAPIEARRSPYKISDLHLVDETIRDACIDPAITSALNLLLGSKPVVCNSLLFEWGSQQYPHFDTFFMPSKTPNMMAASWIALDQVTDQNGPLYYYPKSHTIEPYIFSHGKTTAVFSELKNGAATHIESIVQRHRLKKEFFMANPGDVLIWHAQLLHGGGEIRDPRQKRRSLVTHYWTEMDISDPDDRREFGHGRSILKKPHQYVVDGDILAEVDAFLRNLAVPETLSSQVPKHFDPRLYLARNQDVLKAGESPWQHYVNHGRKEGRIW